jgi:RNA polymerase sigma-54 factor
MARRINRLDAKVRDVCTAFFLRGKIRAASGAYRGDVRERPQRRALKSPSQRFMGLDLRLDQRPDLQLRLAPQIIQSIEILQLQSLDLQNLVQEELDTNEFLEQVPTEEAPEAPPAPETSTNPEPEENLAGREAEFERLETNEVWDHETPRCKSALDHEAADRKQEAMNNAPGRPLSLQELLREQLAVSELADENRAFAHELISHINDIGRLETSIEEIREGHPEVSPEAAEEVLHQIQSMEPRGVGARSTEECLLLQLDPDDPKYVMKRRIIGELFDDLKKNRRPKIAKALDITMDELNELILELADLDYQPGRSAVDETPRYIYPDIIVDWIPPDGYEVRLAQENYPSLRVRPTYKKIYQDPTVDNKYKEEVKRQVDQAKWLVSAIEQRQNTLLRVAKRIVHYQRDFLEFGPHYLWPLKMQQIADDLGIHVSTVSRATHEKYMQTHRGIFSLKSFFGGATPSVDGGVESRSSVRQRVKEIIAQEDKKSPLSDEEIVARLKESFGVEVARRTVTKYRKALKIPSTRQRKAF